MKVVINRCFGGFGVSYHGMKRYFELKGLPFHAYESRHAPGVFPLIVYNYEPVTDSAVKSNEGLFMVYATQPLDANGKIPDKARVSPMDIKRDDPALVQVVEELGAAVNGCYAELAVVEIPDDVEWEIDEYDGYEHIAEKHRTWQ